MSAREYAAKRLHEFANPVSAVVVDAEDVIDAIMKAIKEELTPKDQTFQEFFGLDEQPRLIQGYTAEQWQEIIDGGYLCEYSQNGTHWSKAKWPLEKFHELKGGLFEGDMEKRSFCRPAQIKGVMRPIFVEPVDPDVVVVYFDGSGQVISGSRRWMESEIPRTLATKYIEL